jgi:O-antigen biosynthesis protein WbqV
MLEMGEPVRIVDLARTLVRLQGLQPEEDIQFTYTGLRPGEKLHETLHGSAEDLDLTSLPEVYRLTTDKVSMGGSVLAEMMSGLARDAIEGAEVLNALAGTGWQVGGEGQPADLATRAASA